MVCRPRIFPALAPNIPPGAAPFGASFGGPLGASRKLRGRPAVPAGANLVSRLRGAGPLRPAPAAGGIVCIARFSTCCALGEEICLKSYRGKLPISFVGQQFGGLGPRWADPAWWGASGARRERLRRELRHGRQRRSPTRIASWAAAAIFVDARRDRELRRERPVRELRHPSGSGGGSSGPPLDPHPTFLEPL